MIRTLLVVIFSIVLMIPSGISQGMGSQEKFQIQGRLIKGKPVFKIYPISTDAWFLGIRNGYRISVATKKGDDFGDFKVIEEKLLPGTAAQFLGVTGSKKEYADAMRKLVYEEKYTAEGESFDDMVNASKKMSYGHLGYFLLSTYDPKLSEFSGLQFIYPDGFDEAILIKVEIVGKESYSTTQYINKSSLYAELKSPNIEGQVGDKIATISWSHKSYEKLFTAYQIERSTDGFNFQPEGLPRIFVKESPGGDQGLIVVEDTLPDNYSKFWYRVRGFDAFGYLSDPGDAITLSGSDLTPPPKPGDVDVENPVDSIAQIKWSYEPGADLEGFQIIGSNDKTGRYTLLHDEFLPTDARSFDFNLHLGSFRYYRVIAIDTARNASASDIAILIKYDTIPPQLPDSIWTKVDSNRVVTISWRSSISDDLKGYRVYKSYGLKQRFLSLTGELVTDTVFTDTINAQRLEKAVYYKVTAVDYNYNHSRYSEPVAAIIPDTIPPTLPILEKAFIDNAGNPSLKWIGSSSVDLAGYRVYRKTESDTILVLIDSTGIDKVTYLDKTFGLIEANMAEYFVSAIDSVRNESGLSNSKRVFQKFDKKANQIAIISANNVNNQVKLTWQYSSTNAYGVLVYRSVEGKGFTLIDRVDSGNEYLDEKVKLGKKYIYKIGVIETNGVRHPLSDEYAVKLK